MGICPFCTISRLTNELAEAKNSLVKQSETKDKCCEVLLQRLVDLELQKQDNHARAEEIISARETLILCLNRELVEAKEQLASMVTKFQIASNDYYNVKQQLSDLNADYEMQCQCRDAYRQELRVQRKEEVEVEGEIRRDGNFNCYVWELHKVLEDIGLDVPVVIRVRRKEEKESYKL
jgi:seryl-tRNA synthetase